MDKTGNVMLEIEGLSKSFGGLKAVNHLNLNIYEGEIFGVIGPNGSGKTTAFNLITGFLKPDDGTVRFKGKDITGIKSHQICKAGIARTFQLVKPFVRMTVLQNVMAGRAYGKRPAQGMKQIRSEAEELLKFAGLWSKGSVIASQLGLADRKRLEITRALATKPELLLLDETMAGLNPAEIQDAMRLMKEIRASGITIMLVEHVMQVVLGISDRIAVMNAGENIAEGKPEHIVSNKEVVAAYLGRQYA